MRCSSAYPSNAGRFLDFSAPFDKGAVFSPAFFTATHDIEHFMDPARDMEMSVALQPLSALLRMSQNLHEAI